MGVRDLEGMWVEKGEGWSLCQRGHCPPKGFLFRSWEKLVTSDWSLAELSPIRRQHVEGHLPQWGVSPGSTKLMEPLPFRGKLGSEHPSACKPEGVLPTSKRGRI